MWETERVDKRLVLYEYALRFVGTPYLWGGDDPMGGYDCSGLVLELLQSVGVLGKGDMNAAEMMLHFTAGVIEADFGVLAFYGTGTASHVAFCLNSLQMLEAGGGDHTVLTRADAEEKNAYVRIRPIARRGDLLGLRLPPYPWKG